MDHLNHRQHEDDLDVRENEDRDYWPVETFVLFALLSMVVGYLIWNNR